MNHTTLKMMYFAYMDLVVDITHEFNVQRFGTPAIKQPVIKPVNDQKAYDGSEFDE